MMLDVLVVGDYCLDLILTDLPSEPIKGKEIYSQGIDVMVGGGTFPTAVALRKLGLKTEIHMQLGSDFFSRFVLDTLREEGFNLELVHVYGRPFRRLTVALSYPDDRAFVSFTDTAPSSERGSRFTGDVLRSFSPRHLHFAHLSALLSANELIAEAKQRGITISSDCGWNRSTMDHPDLPRALEQIDVFLPNQQELAYLSNEQDLDQALEVMRLRTSLTVVKLGARGSVVISETGRVEANAIPVHAVETTSAGDCFNAGFLFGWLQGWPIERALQVGNVCGGLSTTSAGWRNTPTLEELTRWLTT